MSEALFHLGMKALIRNAGGDILLLRIDPEHMKHHGHQIDERRSYWDLPGGRVQRGEKIETTLQREVREELGDVKLSDIKPLGMVLSNIRIPLGDETIGLILSIYTCNIPEDSQLILSEEHVEAQWFDKNQAAELLEHKYPIHFRQLLNNL